MNPYIIPGIRREPSLRHYYSIFLKSFPDAKVRKRKREIVRSRQIFMYLMWKHEVDSLTNIGKVCGGYDHSTVIHARDVIQDEIDMNYRDTVEKVELLERKFNEEKKNFCKH